MTEENWEKAKTRGKNRTIQQSLAECSDATDGACLMVPDGSIALLGGIGSNEKSQFRRIASMVEIHRAAERAAEKWNSVDTNEKNAKV